MGYIDGIHVAIYSSTMDPMGYTVYNSPIIMIIIIYHNDIPTIIMGKIIELYDW